MWWSWFARLFVLWGKTWFWHKHKVFASQFFFSCRNSLSSRNEPEITSNLLAKEVSQCYVISPFDKPSFDTSINPISLASKKYLAKKRLAVDMLAPQQMVPEPGKERRSRQRAVSVLLGLVLLWLAGFCEVSAGHVVREGRDRQHGCQLSPRGLLRVGGLVCLEVNCSVSTMSATEAGKRRTASKGWLKRASKKLGALLSKSDFDYIELSDAVEEFDLRLAAFDVSQTEFEYYLEEDKLEADTEVSAKFREESRVNRVKATKKLQELSADDRDSDHGRAVSRASSVEVNLPKLSLPVFSGNVIEWQTLANKMLICCIFYIVPKIKFQKLEIQPYKHLTQRWDTYRWCSVDLSCVCGLICWRSKWKNML